MSGSSASGLPLVGRGAIVTGGASGIGLATVRRLSADGAHVVALDLNAEAADELGIAVVATDVGDDQSVAAGVAAAVDRLGQLDTQLDIVVNNAGIGAQGGIDTNSDDEWARVFNINVMGIARVCRHSLAHLRQSDAASIVNVSSIAATVGLPQRALYSATKGAVSALTRAMAADLIDEGIRVNAVNPGTADTPWVGRLLDSADDPAAERAALEARQPHQRLVSADEIAGAIAYLVSPAAGSTIGIELAVDGGMDSLRLRR